MSNYQSSVNSCCVPQFNCIKIQPRWVQDMKEMIGGIQLHSLLIPGSHNAGAYNKFTSYTGENQTLDDVKAQSKLSDDTVLLRYSVNQGEDIWTQLLFGMRYLDLRVLLSIFHFGDMHPKVSYYEDTPEKFWLVHDFVKQNPL